VKKRLEKNIHWLAISVVAITILALLYPFSLQSRLTVNSSNSEVREKAKEYMRDFGFNPDNYEIELYGSFNLSLIKYPVSRDGIESIEKIQKKDSVAMYGWRVIFYPLAPRSENSYAYFLNLGSSGELVDIQRQLPDSVAVSPITQEYAEQIAKDNLSSKAGIDLTGFTLTEKQAVQKTKRTDYTFRWERPLEIEGTKLVIEAYVQGDEFGGFKKNYYLPEGSFSSFAESYSIYFMSASIFVFLYLIFSMYLFIKKYHQGEVWLSAAGRVFIIFIIIYLIFSINMYYEIGAGIMIGTLNLLYLKYVSLSFNGILINLFFGILLYTTWAVSESFSRSLFPEKLKSFDAYIRGRWFSRQVGESSLRGVALALVLFTAFFLLGVLLTGKGSSYILSVRSPFSMWNTFFPSLGILTQSVISASLTSITIVAFMVTVTYQRWKNKTLSFVFSVVLFTLLSPLTIDHPGSDDMVVIISYALLFGSAATIIYMNYDVLTTLVTVGLFSVLAEFSALLSVSHIAAYLHFAILALALLFPFFLYAMSVYKNEDFVIDDYGVPSHILRISEREVLKRELEIASQVQLGLLPKIIPTISRYEVVGISEPALESGGDYFDYIPLANDKIGIAIGDVSGKGVGAAIYMTLTKGILQAHAEEETSPSTVLYKVNRLLYRTIEKQSFVSMIYGVIDYNSNTITHSRAGHNPAMLFKSADGSVSEITPKGMALGLDDGVLFAKYLEEATTIVEPDDVVLLYTDGVTEARNESGEEYGTHRLTTFLKKHADRSSERFIELLLKDIKSFTGLFPQVDDITLLVIKRIQ